MKKIVHIMVITAGLGFGSVPEASALENKFPPTWEENGTVMERVGLSHLRVGFVFQVYDAAFYSDANATLDDILYGDVPRRLHLKYLRSISRDQFIQAADDSLQAFLSPEALEELQPRIDKLNQWYQGVKKGDEYTLTYLPGRGTELALNGVPLGVIDGGDFATAYFRIWLDETNPYPDFRNRLLGLGS